MIVSRGLPALKVLHKLNINNGQLTQVMRNSHQWNYRVGSAPAPKRLVLIADLVQGFAWWWILWHLWTEPGHIFGEFEYPDPSKWTDEELGIE